MNSINVTWVKIIISSSTVSTSTAIKDTVSARKERFSSQQFCEDTSHWPDIHCKQQYTASSIITAVDNSNTHSDQFDYCYSSVKTPRLLPTSMCHPSYYSYAKFAVASLVVAKTTKEWPDWVGLGGWSMSQDRISVKLSLVSALTGLDVD